MEFLYMLEKIRIPGLNECMLAITTLGEETALIVVALILFWCVDKRQGYYVLSVGFLGNIANQFLKLWFKIPRPWVKDPSFPILEEARAAAGGYSFPSGHTQTAVGTFGVVAVTTKKRWICAVCLALAMLVGFSRMYVGVHTPADVLVGAAMAVLFIMVLHPLVMKNDGKYIPWALFSLAVLSVGYLIYVHSLDALTLDPHNYESGVKNAYTFLGCTSGLLVVWFADRKLNFSTQALWWAQILKVGIGLILVLAVKEGLRSPLEALCGGVLVARAIRYFLIVVVAGIVWPLSFRFFPKQK